MTTFTSVGSPGTVNTASGGKVTPINNLGTSPVPIVARNGQRQTIQFYNPGTVAVYVAPAVTATGAPLVPSLAALGGCFLVLPGDALALSGECQLAFQAFAASGVNNSLTVNESNI
jgi:hypothetical protein